MKRSTTYSHHYDEKQIRLPLVFQFAIEHPLRFLLLPAHEIYIITFLEPMIEMGARGTPQLSARPETYKNKWGWGNSVLVQTQHNKSK